MKKWAFIICVAMLSASCNSILSSRPSGTLSEKQMVDVLVDIHLEEATLKIANDSMARLSDTTDLRIRFARVFKKHDIDPDDFNASLTYYLEHIEEFDKIYVEVINRLTALEATLLQKPGKQTINKINALKQGTSGVESSNPWFRAMNKTDKQDEFKYFDSAKYPETSNKIMHLPGPHK